jgi:hypothetical protein
VAGVAKAMKMGGGGSSLAEELLTSQGHCLLELVNK